MAKRLLSLGFHWAKRLLSLGFHWAKRLLSLGFHWAKRLLSLGFHWAKRLLKHLASACFSTLQVYGPKSETGSYSGVINNFIKRLVMKEGPIINGSGSQTRGFIYVDDVVRANILAATNQNSIGNIFNVGSGVPVSIEALADLLVDLILGKNIVIPYEYRPMSPGDYAQNYADISAIRNQLGFCPKYSIETGLRSYVDYLQKMPLLPSMEVPLLN